MSDKSVEVECDVHGTRFATFVCQHLVHQQNVGFFCSDDPDDSHPDAWCAKCEQVRLEEGEWNENSEAFAKITLLCAGCYEVAKARNRTDGSEPRGFVCGTCGEYHDELPMDFGADAPALYGNIPADERESRCDLTPDLCVIDEEHFFIRGCLELPVIDGDQPFVWGVWASLSKENFRRTFELWEVEGRETEPTYFGWLSTALPLYPETLHLKTHVHTRPLGQRPLIELEPTDHPLAVQQREGITMKRVREIAEALLHGGEK